MIIIKEEEKENKEVDKIDIRNDNNLKSNDEIINDKDDKATNEINNSKKNIKVDENDRILHIKDIKKNFEEKEVLKGVTFDLKPNEIFVLLGHNGAGKTTLISILTGLINATSGSAMLSGYNILSSEFSEHFRKMLGICPQHDVLFNDLTVEEHLELFCQFKSEKTSGISEEISRVLKEIQLEDKKTTKASDLSGGQKRKLSVGLALIGGSSIIFLDEPTSGMDITSRRNLWDILKKCLAGKIIILTTHFMEEASVLGNRIGILSEGKMQCTATPLELIDKYTNHINLNITKGSKADDDHIIQFVLQNLASLNINFENFNRDILFRIPTDDKGIIWSNFFKLLDQSLVELKIKSYSISKSTLEDVFINFSKIKNKMDRKKNEDIYELNKQNALKNSTLLLDENNYEKNNDNYKSKFCKDFRVSFMKRVLQVKRDKKTLMLEIVCPILLTLIGCLVGYIELLEKNKSFPLHINQITNDSQIIYYNYIGDDSQYFYDLDRYFSPKSNVELKLINTNYRFNSQNDEYLLDDINEIYKIKREGEKDRKAKSFVFYRPSLIDEDINIYGFNIIIDIKARQAAPIYTDFLMNNIVSTVVNKRNKNIEIEMINEPFQYTYKEKQEKKSRNQFLILFLIDLTLSLIHSNFITIIIK